MIGRIREKSLSSKFGHVTFLSPNRYVDIYNLALILFHTNFFIKIGINLMLIICNKTLACFVFYPCAMFSKFAWNKNF